ncbi:hypothetical protein [Salinibacterium sp. SWN248]|uniref:hypothetical protein n=1 Tax=Salinibacterium sp. SWN248 TaxID=2792056 RepID=UPI0018CF2521|nr:hypothetical protein [Salinibacterium sp. SWN248]MBH0022601.1 hypothetical protein [Salinibacterium sp. SWN248]
MSITRKKGMWIGVSVVVTAFVIVYLLRLAYLTVAISEWEVPPTSSIALPQGSEIVAVDEKCASGGCWSLISVRPPDGMTPDELSSELGTTPREYIAGSFWTPFTTELSSEVQGQLLVITAGYAPDSYIP